MSLENIIIIGIRNLPDSLNMIDLFNKIYCVFNWNVDSHGKKPVGLDYYSMSKRNPLLKIDIVRRNYKSKFGFLNSISGFIFDCGNGKYIINFEIDKDARRLYGRLPKTYCERLRRHLKEQYNDDIEVFELEKESCGEQDVYRIKS